MSYNKVSLIIERLIYVIARCPCHKEGAKKLIDWAKGDDGFSVTRTHKGFKHIELLVDEDNKTITLLAMGLELSF